MLQATRIIMIGCASLALVVPAVFSVPKPRSISSSRQFLVYGSDPGLRGAVCDLAEKTKRHLLRLLDLGDEWQTPLIVNLNYLEANFPETATASLAVSQLGYGLKLQLDLVITRELKASEVQRELLRATLMEMIYRDRRDLPPGSSYVAPPDWLLDGILGLQAGVDSDWNAELLHALLTQNRIVALGAIVNHRRDQLDAASGKIYNAYSQALIQLLLDAPDGKRKLGRYIRDLADAPNDQLADLRVHFPEILRRSPERWWALAVAHLSASNRYQLLSAAATREELERLLRFRIAAPDGTSSEYSLGDYVRFRKLPAHRAVLDRVGRHLRLLATRAHPLYQPAVQQAYAVLLMLLDGKTRQLTERLTRMASYRAAADRQATAIDDYLNWYEATQFKRLSGAFIEILNGAEEDGQRRRRDPISVYLDSCEMVTNFN